jgi:hypothetical protein
MAAFYKQATASASSNSAVWRVWSTNVTNATTTARELVWTAWSEGFTVNSTSITTAATSTESLLWRVWNDQVQAITWRQVRETPEARAERSRREAEAKRVQEQAALQRRQADERAERLLQSALTPEQRDELRSKQHFHCRSRSGRLYRIHRGTHGNVRVVEGNREVESLCVQPNDVPAADAMLAQKLHIEHCEDDFRRTANIRRITN